MKIEPTNDINEIFYKHFPQGTGLIIEDKREKIRTLYDEPQMVCMTLKEYLFMWFVFGALTAFGVAWLILIL